MNKDFELIVETRRSGNFKFQVGIEDEVIQPLADRVWDAQKRFSSMPILPDVATKLEQDVLVSSVFGTNTIEGGELSEEETKELLIEGYDAKNEHEKRVTNIKEAYEIAEGFANLILDDDSTGTAINIKEVMLTDLHEKVTQGLTHPTNIPGKYRNPKKGEVTKVGDSNHGGIYTTPKSLYDIKLLVKNYLNWINSDEIRNLDPLIRAPLAHFYFELIHPFGDGNGRVGRVLEALILKCAGFKYAHFALSRYYLENIDEYFTIFNMARKASEKKTPYPNTIFLKFVLNGLLIVINKLHDRVNSIVSFLLYDVALNENLRTKKINNRQFTLIRNLIPIGLIHQLNDIKSQTWYAGLYEKLTERTKYRDFEKLESLDLIKIDKKKLILKIPGQT
jgi:cell filamentation protein, protein adenylyltransferase